jgi:alpha-galactosidase
MNAATKNILLNEEIIAINQDELGKQCEPKIKNDGWDVYTKPLQNGDIALAIVNRGQAAASYALNFPDIGLADKYEIRDVWQHKIIGKAKKWKGSVLAHETKVFRLKKI